MNRQIYPDEQGICVIKAVKHKNKRILSGYVHQFFMIKQWRDIAPFRRICYTWKDSEVA